MDNEQKPRTITLPLHRLKGGHCTIQEGRCYVADCFESHVRIIKYIGDDVIRTRFGEMYLPKLQMIELTNGNIWGVDNPRDDFMTFTSVREITNEIYDKLMKVHDTYMSALNAIVTQIPNEQQDNG